MKYILCLSISLWASVFQNPNIVLENSSFLQERLSNQDSLLPEFDGETSLRRLFSQNPDFWEIEDLKKHAKIETKLSVKMVFLDGIQEEAFCNVDTLQSSDTLWRLEIGLDFLSGASNNVATHVSQCLAEALEKLGLVFWEGDQKISQAPKLIEDGFTIYKVNPELKPKDRIEVLRIQKEVEKSGKCPQSIYDYSLLDKLYTQIKDMSLDLPRIDQELSSDTLLFSCSWSQEWNSFITDSMKVECNLEDEVCQTHSKQEGIFDWKMHPQKDFLVYQGPSLFGIPLGTQSIHEGGKILDLRLLPLSRDLYLEIYLDLQQKPIALGWLMKKYTKN